MANHMNVDFLHSLVDKVVRINKGGPESRIGRLLAVKKDYVVLHTEHNEVLFYNTEHIKSVSEDSKGKYKLNYSSNLSKNGGLAAGIHADKATVDQLGDIADVSSFGELMSGMNGLTVRFNQGGPESRRGTLVGVNSDYAILNTAEDGMLYYNLHHIKSVSAVDVYQIDVQSDQTIENGENRQVFPVKVDVGVAERARFIDAENTLDLYRQLKNRWVRINRGGPDMVDGILVDAFEDKLILVNGQEVLYIPTFHIKNVNYITEAANQQQSNFNTAADTNNDSGSSSSENGKSKTKNKSSKSSKSSTGRSKKRSSNKGSKLAKSSKQKKKRRK